MSTSPVSMKVLARQTGCKSHLWLFSLLKETGLLDSEREPLAPYRYQGLFQVRDVKTPSGKVVKQTFVTEKGIVFISGVIVGSRKKTPDVCSENSQAENAGRTPKRPEAGTGASAGLG